HRDLRRVQCVGVEHAGAELDVLRRQGAGRQDDRPAAQEQVMAHPKLVEPGCFGSPGKFGIGRYRQIVVQADAEAHRQTGPSGRIASASISTRYSSPTRRLTSTSVLAGRVAPK